MEGYNGWSNYPTWCVNLWLANDEGLYNEVTDLVTNLIDDEDNADTYEVATELKEFVEGLLPDLGASFAEDLIGWAVGHVDWSEIAESWIKDAAE